MKSSMHIEFPFEPIKSKLFKSEVEIEKQLEHFIENRRVFNK